MGGQAGRLDLSRHGRATIHGPFDSRSEDVFEERDPLWPEQPLDPGRGKGAGHEINLERYGSGRRSGSPVRRTMENVRERLGLGKQRVAHE